MLCRRLLIYFLLALPAVCVGQTDNFFVTGDGETRRTFYAGFAGGLNFSQVDGDTYDGYHKIGLNCGAVVYAHLTNHIGLSAELLYSQKGSKGKRYTEDFGIGYVDEYDLDLKYAEIPLMLYFVPSCLGNKFHIRGGASWAWLISARERINISNATNFDPALSPFHKQDISYLADVSYMLYKGLFLSVRYSYSMIPFRDAQYVSAQYYHDAQYNNAFSLRVMYLIK